MNKNARPWLIAIFLFIAYLFWRLIASAIVEVFEIETRKMFGLEPHSFSHFRHGGHDE